ncbi:MAG: helix-turn-helix domain-containing protein [Desulfuromonadaceae bacterium]
MSILSSQEIGKRMREIRKRRGMTQEQLAEILEVSFQQVQKYENGSNKLSTDKLQSVALSLSVSVASFFDKDKVDGLLLSEQEQELVRGFRSIANPEIQNFIVDRLFSSSRK